MNFLRRLGIANRYMNEETIALWRREESNGLSTDSCNRVETPLTDEMFGQPIALARGEGYLPHEMEYTEIGVLLRPHQGNVLGRCTALQTTSKYFDIFGDERVYINPIYIVNNESDLSQAMRVFWKCKDCHSIIT